MPTDGCRDGENDLGALERQSWHLWERCWLGKTHGLDLRLCTGLGTDRDHWCLAAHSVDCFFIITCYRTQFYAWVSQRRLVCNGQLMLRGKGNCVAHCQPAVYSRAPYSLRLFSKDSGYLHMKGMISLLNPKTLAMVHPSSLQSSSCTSESASDKRPRVIAVFSAT